MQLNELPYDHVLLNLFHPCVAGWFRKTLGKPTDVQFEAWNEIRRRQHTLISAPTGSGKTLAAFFSIIDDLLRQGLAGSLKNETYVLYVSPLKALSNDIHRNLQIPLAGILEELHNAKLPEVAIRVLVRTGDTRASERAAMVKHPPHILVTTPESLYLMLTSENGRKMLHTVHTVIVDEIHALVGSKRGSHLSLSLERLDALTKQKCIRIGISATQKPIGRVAQFLTGCANNGAGVSPEFPDCTIIDVGHRRNLELSVEVPKSPLSAVMANEVWDEIYDRLAELIQEHRTTLIFVNTRRLAERAAFNLSRRLGEGIVGSHHGSMSKEHRLSAEQRLKSGELRALVATSSLELGIDIGWVDLVCQLGSPKSIGTFLQRIGRSGHTIHGMPKGKVFPLSRDELVDSVALLDAVRRGELDEIDIPEKPLDILTQQIVAEVSAEEYDEDGLFRLLKAAYPYRNVSRKEFEELLTMLEEGFTPQRGRKAALIHRDRVHNRVQGRPNARLRALLGGGAIPDNFDFEVILQPTGTFVGTVNEDFAIESVAGDTFQLGNRTWRIAKVENGRVLVEDATGEPPSMPFWLGEAPSRSKEFSLAVSRFRGEISKKLGDVQAGIGNNGANNSSGQAFEEGRIQETIQWLTQEFPVSSSAAEQLVLYLASAKAALGVLPTHTTLVMERFFDQAGDMHLVIHSPYGSRLNRAWGLALRKRFCRKFNFELQAAATEDAILLSLGSTHSFPLDEVWDYLKPETVREILIQALLDAPMFEVRWRWNATRALAVMRQRMGKRVPPQLQRMQSQDLLALAFPDQQACIENIAGDRQIPDHPLVRQTISDCLHEAMDIEALEQLVSNIRKRTLTLIARDLKEPSPLAHEVVTAKPYAFLDDAPLEERRTLAVTNRRWLSPDEAAGLGQLDMEAIEAVKREAWPEVTSAEELHDALVLCGFLTAKEGKGGHGAGGWESYLQSLIDENRAVVFTNGVAGGELWVAVERLPQMICILPEASFTPRLDIPEKISVRAWSPEDALVDILRGRLGALGPVTEIDLAQSTGLSESAIQQALLMLEHEGSVFRGRFTPGTQLEEWCERRLLSRIHRLTLQRLRREIEPVSATDFMRFLFAWHRLTPNDELEGPSALEGVLRQLEGFEAPAAAWEGEILPLRVKDYDFAWLDALCLSGKFAWGRFRPPRKDAEESRSSSPVRSTPIALLQRGNLKAWKSAIEPPEEIANGLSSYAKAVLDSMQKGGALFFDDIVRMSGLLKTQVEEAIADLVARGFLTSDSFGGLRALLVPEKYRARRTSRRRKPSPFDMSQAGRWSLLRRKDDAAEVADRHESAETVARVLLSRYGVVFRKLLMQESFAPHWWELVQVLRRLEARGEIRGGRFVDGFAGEQYALPEAVTMLRAVRREEPGGALVSISAADPLNLMGIVTGGRRVASFTGNRVLYRDGVPVAVKEGKETRFLAEPAYGNDENGTDRVQLERTLIRRHIPEKLRAYLGRGGI